MTYVWIFSIFYDFDDYVLYFRILVYNFYL
ncbi:hypothetical protein Si097_00712 [Streptococcus infantarius subsp. infantarius]|nr:hypothetical protein [Streptococcus infantarius subsp. infantarius]MCO4611095.1 hypothetical protein [Streptococcus infantarius subsp. infantarius]